MKVAQKARPAGDSEPVKVIGGRTFVFGMLPPDKGYKVFMTLVRNFGGSLMSAVGEARRNGGLTSKNKSAIVDSMTGDFLSKLDDDEIQWCMETLFSVTACRDQAGGGRCTLVGTFAGGRLFQAFQVAFEAAKVNFADFLAAKDLISSLVGRLEKEQESSQSSPPTSTGTSSSPAE